MIDWFMPKKRLQCGGNGVCEIVVRGKVSGIIEYRRPTSDEKLNYVYQMQKGLGSEAQLKELDKTENKAKKCHEILIRDLSTPFAKTIFEGAKLFYDESNKPIERLAKDKQFDLLAKYYGYALVDLVALAYATDGAVKKKS